MIRQVIKDFRMDYKEHVGLECTAPCSLYSVLLMHRLIDNPYFKDNCIGLGELSREGCSFTAEFNISAAAFTSKNILLRFYGLDTLAEIELNGMHVARTDNMHRTYTFDVKPRLKLGVNCLRVKFFSPLAEMDARQAANPVTVSSGFYSGASHVRKALYMTGSPFSPMLADMGICGSVELVAFNHKLIDNVTVRQIHSEREVTLDLAVETIGHDDSSRALATLVSPGGNVYYCGFVDGKGTIKISNPNLWWPRGLGVQNLYKLTVNLYHNGEIEDTREMKIGLRTLTLAEGKSDGSAPPAFLVNGVRFFAFGADYIPEDSILSRRSPERSRELLAAAADANFNMLRVRTEGVYPPDYFYDMCDELGLVVWQQIMSVVPDLCMSPEMRDNLRAELICNLSRIKHHASLGLISVPPVHCMPSTECSVELHKELVCRIAEALMPDTQCLFEESLYDSSEAYKDGISEEYLDVASEVDKRSEVAFSPAVVCGIPSLPSYKTLCEFLDKDSMNLLSSEAGCHLACEEESVRILAECVRSYLYPSGISELSYASQLTEAEAVRDAVMGLRRNRDKNMIAIYQQLNDCWHTISPSGIDYCAKYKALHYMTREFFSPVTVDARIEGTRVIFNLSNERLNECCAKLVYSILDSSNGIVMTDTVDITASAMTAVDVHSFDFSSIVSGMEKEYYLAYSLSKGNSVLSKGTLLFTKPRYYKFKKPNISWSINGSGTEFSITLSSDCFARRVEMDFEQDDAVFEHNYFDITDNAPIRISFKTRKHTAAEILRRQFKIRSTYDIGRTN